MWFLLAAVASAIESRPSVVTYVDAAGHRRIYSFAEGNTGHLVVNYWDGFSWRWADQGKPVGTSGVYRPSAITYLSGSVQRIYVFDEGSNGDLVVNYWDGSSWHWADQAGLPLSLSANPSAITYLSGTQRRIYAFVEGINGDLLVNYWDGFSWHWADQGTPTAATVVGTVGTLTVGRRP